MVELQAKDKISNTDLNGSNEKEKMELGNGEEKKSAADSTDHAVKAGIGRKMFRHFVASGALVQTYGHIFIFTFLSISVAFFMLVTSFSATLDFFKDNELIYMIISGFIFIGSFRIVHKIFIAGSIDRVKRLIVESSSYRYSQFLSLLFSSLFAFLMASISYLPVVFLNSYIARTMEPEVVNRMISILNGSPEVQTIMMFALVPALYGMMLGVFHLVTMMLVRFNWDDGNK